MKRAWGSVAGLRARIARHDKSRRRLVEMRNHWRRKCEAMEGDLAALKSANALLRKALAS